MNANTFTYKTIVFISMIVFLGVISNGYTTTYYIDATGGNDSNNGFSPNTAWQTISKVNGESFSPGDSILFQCGEVWREGMTVPSSGSAVSPIVIASYDSGDQPIISGATLISGSWTDGGDNIWYKYVDTDVLAADLSEVRFDEIAGQKQGSIVDLDVDEEWYFDGATDILYVYSAENPGTRFSVVEYPARNIGITSTGKSNVVIDGFQIKRFRKDVWSTGVSITTGDNCVVGNCDITEMYYEENPNYPTNKSWEDQRGTAISFKSSNNFSVHDNYMKDSGGTMLGADLGNGGIIDSGEIYNNEITNFNRGIVIASNNNGDGNIQGIKIHDNYIHDFDNYYVCNAWHRDGIHIYEYIDPPFNIREFEIYNNFFEDNTSEPGATAWIFLEKDITDFDIHHNVFGDGGTSMKLFIGAAGSIPDGRGDHEIYNNVFLGNIRMVESSYNKVINNIFINGGHLFTSDAESIEGLEMDYNIVIPYSGNKVMGLNGNEYTLSEAQDAGYMIHGYTDDPIFVGSYEATPNDASVFELQFDSPAIDAGKDLGFTSDYKGNLIPQGDGPDIGAFEFSPYEPPPPPTKSTLLNQNYPNPFNPLKNTTTISFSLVKDTYIKLYICNLSGRKIKELQKGFFSEGSHSVIWDASGLSSGIYFYTLEIGDSVKSKKMTLLK